MRDISLLLEDAVKQMPLGAFLVTGERHNPMTIGWAQWGVIWGKPVCTVLVRHSRYSHQLIENGCFTVSVPRFGERKEELRLCGTLSGRDVDKLQAAGLKTLSPRSNGVGGIAGCAVHFECKTVLKTEVSMDKLDPVLYGRYYDPAREATADGDPHTVYFGEIIAAYREDQAD